MSQNNIQQDIIEIIIEDPNFQPKQSEINTNLPIQTDIPITSDPNYKHVQLNNQPPKAKPTIESVKRVLFMVKAGYRTDTIERETNLSYYFIRRISKGKIKIVYDIDGKEELLHEKI